ncbi:hypothetical protein CF327_g2491 [Tilletia walkeri]|uniref:Uncharacterized protein n=1 Tax=Tilletia walkeri TaxID=117179 RepID=A0A8X7NF72_9BASI|nr:hypothetical protein CF327_g2491 [Tilletia walkeri]KAE8270861.1 hypothetical protein A4X09_0g1494 [Tilletia walkeri]
MVSPVRTGPIPLGYPMTKSRQRSLVIAIVLMILLNIVAPCVVYYVLRYAVKGYGASDLFGYTSLAMGTVSVLQWPYRYFQLCRQNGACSPVKPRTASLLPPVSSTEPQLALPKLGALQKFKWVLVRADSFQWGLLIGIIFGAIPLIVSAMSTGRRGMFIPLILTYPIVMGMIGLAMLGITLLSLYPEVKQPFRLSSVKKGSSFRPGLAYLWEDITAVDGGGGYEFRQAFSRRFESSPHFRKMNTVLSFFLGISFILYFVLALILTIILANYNRNTRLSNRLEAWSFGANFLLFTIWNSLTALIATFWGRRYMAEEERRWKRKNMYGMPEYERSSSAAGEYASAFDARFNNSCDISTTMSGARSVLSPPIAEAEVGDSMDVEAQEHIRVVEDEGVSTDAPPRLSMSAQRNQP